MLSGCGNEKDKDEADIYYLNLTGTSMAVEEHDKHEAYQKDQRKKNANIFFHRILL